MEDARRLDRCILTGKAWVVDGDTIVIDGVHIRIAGIDAPELNHPYGQASKWAMVRLCRGRTVTARIRPELSYDRVVAHCRLDDGTDIAEALVAQGLALDWPAFSKGHYSRFEPPGIRKKLWKTAIRQRG
ncbi:thermonuclease family protein [Kangsaoukella pontilimi]|uniref:thermonuclease family protein n=1 Tax=Kangsaoukella pontilimi TaxID=2691042 RepID=UPI0029CAA683|nr:thermonuclease family protein [Kangsaoukella pontilimi]